MVGWQEATLPKCHSSRASKNRQPTACPGNLCDLRLYASGAPDLNTSSRVLSCGLEIAQKVERDCQSDVASYHKGSPRNKCITISMELIDSS